MLDVKKDVCGDMKHILQFVSRRVGAQLVTAEVNPKNLWVYVRVRGKTAQESEQALYQWLFVHSDTSAFPLSEPVQMVWSPEESSLAWWRGVWSRVSTVWQTITGNWEYDGIPWLG
jgi:hypothetical protein